MDEVEPIDDELIIAGAANLAAWHDSSIHALGLPTSSGSWWWTASTPRPWIYFTAIALRPPLTDPDRRSFDRELLTHLEDPNGAFQAVCESFDRYDMDGTGLHHRTTGRWFTRPPGTPPEGRESELEIVVVETEDDLHDYERATCAAFRAPPPVAPFEIHAPGILHDPRMHVLLGRVDGEIAGGAMAYITDDLLGIYGVGIVPGHRGHGHATALTTAALALAPDRPAVLQPSAEAESLYRRLGFTEVGRFTHWG
jgi:ribosomal protein S18 acetylase RimI-like enzyme